MDENGLAQPEDVGNGRNTQLEPNTEKLSRKSSDSNIMGENSDVESPTVIKEQARSALGVNKITTSDAIAIKKTVEINPNQFMLGLPPPEALLAK